MLIINENCENTDFISFSYHSSSGGQEVSPLSSVALPAPYVVTARIDHENALPSGPVTVDRSSRCLSRDLSH